MEKVKIKQIKQWKVFLDKVYSSVNCPASCNITLYNNKEVTVCQFGGEELIECNYENCSKKEKGIINKIKRKERCKNVSSNVIM